MERSASILGIDTDSRNDQIIHPLYPFHLSIPFSRILAIRNDEFFYAKMLVCTMPVDKCIRMEVCSDPAFILGKDSSPKTFYIQFTSPILSRFSDPIVS